MLPPTATAIPAAWRQWPTSAVVVDFPFVPVIPTMRAAGCASIAISISLTTLTLCSVASLAAGCGAGCACAIPGLITIRSISVQGQSDQERRCAPSGSCSVVLWSSARNTVAPAASRDAAAARPDLPSPRTPTIFPVICAGINIALYPLSVVSVTTGQLVPARKQ